MFNLHKQTPSIENPTLAEELAYVEKPYRDTALAKSRKGRKMAKYLISQGTEAVARAQKEYELSSNQPIDKSDITDSSPLSPDTPHNNGASAEILPGTDPINNSAPTVEAEGQRNTPQASD